MFVAIILVSLLILFLSYLYLKPSHDYWKKRNVVQAENPRFLVGNYGDWIFQRTCIGQNAQKILQKYPDEPYVGAYVGTKPVLIIQDPELVKLITTKDFYYFNSREIMDHTYKEPMGRVLFFSYGETWKLIRHNTSPLFSSAKMKNMFYLIEKCVHTLEDFIQRRCEESPILDAKDIMAKYTIQCICICAFGVDTKSMMKEVSSNDFVRIGEAIFESSKARGLALVSRATWPAIFYGLGFKTFPDDIHNFFHKVAISVFKTRNYTPTKKNDFVDLILTLKKNKFIDVDGMKKGDDKIRVEVDDELLVMQCVQFFAAGYETSASTLTFTLYELAKNKDAQEKAIAEVDAYLARHNNKLYYECVLQLPYLDACLNEALRFYPVIQILAREVYEDYTLPTGLKLERGTRIQIPAYAFHRDPRNFPEPEKYIPERHLNEEKEKIKPYTFLPFGEGPRVCIGKRFSSMQTLTGLMTVLKKYRVEVAEGVPTEVMDIIPTSIVSQPRSPIHLKFILRDGWEKRMYDRSE